MPMIKHMGLGHPSKNTAGYLAIAAFVVSFVLISCGGGGGGGSSSSGATGGSTGATSSTSGNGPLGCSLDEYTPNYDNETDPSTSTHNSIYWWNHFPLKVYFNSDPTIQGQSGVAVAMSGFNAWSATAGTTVAVQVNSASDADIVVTFENHANAPGSGGTLGQTSWSYVPSTHRTTSATMDLVTWDTMTLAQMADGLRHTAQHEFGHVLFLGGHSTASADTMYPWSSIDTYSALTTRDNNSLNTAYCGSFSNRSISRAYEGPLAHATISCLKE